ncbi:MAG: cobalamin-independent methionine synthase II family protein [Calditrichaeota bacterium]|nr:cobalamin-independent methionine synthase II family protein [Calditrichota bacterium]
MSANKPEILTTTVGSYPVPAWLAANPSEQALIDAIRVVVDTQRQAGIDLPTDGELYRFDINHPETNGMIDYFVRPLGGIRTQIGRTDWIEFSRRRTMGFRLQPAGVVESEIEEGSLNLYRDWLRTYRIAGKNFKFTLTSPYMLARTLLDRYYKNFEKLTLRLADVLAEQVPDLQCACVQVDEANITGNPEDGDLAAEAINRILDKVRVEKAVHFCFGNYGGQTIQQGNWKKLIRFLNQLRADHLVLEVAHRPESDLDVLQEIDQKIALGIGVIDIKVNHVETPEEVARRIEYAAEKLGQKRIAYVHPDCGFWMLKRSIADRKIVNLVKGRDLFLGI